MCPASLSHRRMAVHIQSRQPRIFAARLFLEPTHAVRGGSLQHAPLRLVKIPVRLMPSRTAGLSVAHRQRPHDRPWMLEASPRMLAKPLLVVRAHRASQGSKPARQLALLCHVLVKARGGESSTGKLLMQQRCQLHNLLPQSRQSAAMAPVVPLEVILLL